MIWSICIICKKSGLFLKVNTSFLLYAFQYFFRHHHDNLNTKDSLAGQFSQLTNKIWCGKYSSLRPADFKDAFGQQWRDFRDYRQVKYCAYKFYERKSSKDFLFAYSHTVFNVCVFWKTYSNFPFFFTA